LVFGSHSQLADWRRWARGITRRLRGSSSSSSSSIGGTDIGRRYEDTHEGNKGVDNDKKYDKALEGLSSFLYPIQTRYDGYQVQVRW